MASELLPCPFCGAPEDELMIFADPEEAFDNSGPSRRIQCAGCHIEAPFYPSEAEAIAAWNTRPTPAATDTGLVTVAQAYVNEDGECEEIAWIEGLFPHPECIQLVTRSQAAELLAAKDAENASLKAGIKRLSDEQELLAETGESDMISVVKLAARLSEAEAEAERWHKKAMDAGVISHSDGTTSHPMRKERDDLKADNAALTARVKGLEQVNAKLCDDVIDYELKIAERDTSIKALEAKLAAAEPLLTIWDELPDNTSSAGLMAAWFIKAGTIVREARAALGGKPS